LGGLSGIAGHALSADNFDNFHHLMDRGVSLGVHNPQFFYAKFGFSKNGFEDPMGLPSEEKMQECLVRVRESWKRDGKLEEAQAEMERLKQIAVEHDSDTAGLEAAAAFLRD
jgi:hypothetical protein